MNWKCLILMRFMAYVPMVLVALWLSSHAQARERGDLVPGSRYTSGRGAALGDAFTPLADDAAAALFYDPSAIARLRGFEAEPMNVQGQINADYLSMFNRNAYKVYSLSGYADELGARQAMYPGLSGSVLPNIGFRGFGAGVLLQSRLTGHSDGSSIQYRSLYEFVPAIGGGVRLASGVLRLGYVLQYVHHAYGDITVPSVTDPLGYDQQLREGAGLSHNVGAALSLPVRLLPQFNVVVRNVLGLRYTLPRLFSFSRNSSGTPADEPMTIDLGASMQPKIGAGAFLNLAIVWRDFTDESGMHWLGRIAAGGEFSFRNQFFIRGGWGSGYLHAGIGLRRKTADLSLSWFAEEFGDSYHAQEDRRYMLHYQIRVF
jgi:hypothetical protein